MMKRLTVTLSLLFIAPAAHAEDLLEVYRLARDNDAVWAQARAAREAKVEQGPQGLSQLLPTVTATASAAKLDQDSTTSLFSGNTRYRSDAYGLQLTQPVYRKQNFAAYAQGQSAVSQAEAELAAARQELILRASGAYFDVLAAEDALDFARAEKQAIGRQLDLAKRNYSVGSKTLVDVHEAEARFDLAAAAEVAADSELNAKRAALVQIIRQQPGSLAKLAARLPLAAPQPADVESWTAAATAHNPLVKARGEALAIANQEIEKSRGGHYPTLDLVASHSYSDAGGSSFGTSIETTTNQIALQLQVPLYQGGGQASKVRESLARRDEAREGVVAAEREAARQARDAYIAVVNGIARVRALEQGRASNQKALESTVQGFETGVRNGIDVLNAQRDLYRIKRDLSRARYDYLLGGLRLKAAAGSLGDDDVAALNALLHGK